MNQETPPPGIRRTFDEDLQKVYKEVTFDMLLEHPELRSVVVIFDYVQSFNDQPTLKHGLWLTAKGEARDYAETIGSFRQTLKMLDHQFQQTIKLQAAIDDELHSKTKQLIELRETLAKTQEASSRSDVGDSV